MANLVFVLIVWCTRPIAAVLRLAGWTTQQTIEWLWPFHAALRRLGGVRRVVRAQGARFQYDTPDLVPLKLSLIGAHEYDVTDLLRRILCRGDVFVDVGANIGYHTVLAAPRVRPGLVVAVEASPRNRQALMTNLALNDLDNVRVVPNAAWSRSGVRLALHVPDPYNLGANSLLSNGPVECEVETMTMDDLVRNLRLKVDCIKIDVEGAELEVLEGMASLLQESPLRAILCALDHPDRARREETRRVLAAAGFTAVDVATGHALAENEAPRANVLFTRETASP